MAAISSDRLAGLVYGSLAGDSLALGAHWIYDQNELQTKFGRVTELLAPRPDSYHPRRQRGEQTHYGDQTLVLLESLAVSGKYDHADFAQRWVKMWDGYPDYLDHATKDTLAKRQAGGGASESQELGGAARIAPLLAATARESLERQIAVARQQTGLTHGSAIALDAAEYLTRIVHAILAGSEIWPAIEAAGQGGYTALAPVVLLAKVEKVKDRDALAAADELGQACPAEQALPTILALLQRFAHDPETALIENVMAGGDSAARGLALGMILGARHGRAIWPARWLGSLTNAPRVEALLARIG